MKEVAGMLKRRFENIITYLKHRITNPTSESLNAKIQWVKYTARGFRNKQNFINALYFHCAGWILPRQPLNSRKRQINKRIALQELKAGLEAEIEAAYEQHLEPWAAARNELSNQYPPRRIQGPMLSRTETDR